MGEGLRKVTYKDVMLEFLEDSLRLVECQLLELEAKKNRILQQIEILKSQQHLKG